MLSWLGNVGGAVLNGTMKEGVKIGTRQVLTAEATKQVVGGAVTAAAAYGALNFLSPDQPSYNQWRGQRYMG
jgi:hypothetical protein